MHLLDARSQWHRVGLRLGRLARAGAAAAGAALLHRARAAAVLGDRQERRLQSLAVIDSLIKRNVSALMLADIGTLPHDIKERVEQWVKKGGILVRFAGPRLEKGGDDLLPVPLRLGGRTLGGALSWATPQPLAPFGDDSLFAGLTPPAEVLVNKQVLADPAGLGPEVKVWARLKDGTPLVTAAKRGDGQLIFFHVTANSDWSNLPLSGLFVEMLRRIASLGGTGGVPASRWSATARAARRTRRPPPRCWRRCRCSTASASSRTRRRRRRPSPPPRSPMPSPAPRTRPATTARPARRARSTC